MTRSARLAWSRTPSLFVATALAIGAGQATHADESGAYDARTVTQSNEPPQEVPDMKVSLRIKDRVITASLIDNETTRDFISLLPLQLTMKDLFGREKFAQLPRAISEAGPHARTFAVGEMVYWPPGPDVAIFYRHDGQTIPSPGIIVIGKLDASSDALNVSGSVEVAIELAGERGSHPVPGNPRSRKDTP